MYTLVFAVIGAALLGFALWRAHRQRMRAWEVERAALFIHLRMLPISDNDLPFLIREIDYIRRCP